MKNEMLRVQLNLFDELIVDNYTTMEDFHADIAI